VSEWAADNARWGGIRLRALHRSTAEDRHDWIYGAFLAEATAEDDDDDDAQDDDDEVEVEDDAKEDDEDEDDDDGRDCCTVDDRGAAPNNRGADDRAAGPKDDVDCADRDADTTGAFCCQREA